MQRRDLLIGGAMAGAAMILANITRAQMKNSFDLNFAPHPGMFKNLAGDNIMDQIRFAADNGFTAWEDNDMRMRTPNEQEAMGKLLEELGMRMGVFVAHEIHWDKPTMVLGDQEYGKKFLAEITTSIDVAKRCGAKWATVVPGVIDLKLHKDYQMTNIAESMKCATELWVKHDIVFVMEPLNNYNDHPGLILKEIPQAYYLMKAIDSPSVKILFDIYHQQIQEGNIINNIDMAWDEIGYFQVGDAPGRNEPTTGEINYKNIFRHIKNRGYDGVVGMEHGNSIDGVAGEQAVIDAYKNVGQFL